MSRLKMTPVLFALVLLLGTLASASFHGSVQAACQPGQMHEANLAYKSAEQFINGKQWDQAIARMNSIVEVCPEHVEASRGLGTAFMGKGNFDIAAKWFSKVVQLRGKDVQAGDFANLAKAYAKLKQYKQARAEYMKAEKLEPDDCGVLFNLGVMHYATKYHTDSVETLQRALGVCPQYKDPILKQLAKSADAAAKQQQINGNVDKANYYKNLMNEYSGAAGGSTTYDLVKKKMAAKQYQEASVLLKRMLAKDPKQPNAWLTLARASDGAGDKAGSIKAYNKYFELKPSDAKNYGTMIQVMVEAGQCSAAAQKAASGSKRMAGQSKEKLASLYYSWGLALECQEDFAGAKSKFQVAASSGSRTYAGPARTQVGRMEDFLKMTDAQRKKAAQK
ncbi:MAG: tetratricopeptide repeat protein [bacterium]|nr:tetratricopeptide repeat protein [bacterium]